jgi:hypothetical protein
LLSFVRQVTGKTAKSATILLDQVRYGAERAIDEGRRYARRHREAKPFFERFADVVNAGLKRLVA